MNRNLFFIIILTSLCLIISAPKNYPFHLKLLGKEINFVISSPTLKFGKFQRDLTIKQGLDLQGGVEVLLEADMSQLELADKKNAIESAREVISRRVDLYGVSEPVIKTIVSGDSYRISVALPGVNNTKEALDLIGSTAQLDFREAPPGTEAASILSYLPTGLTGKDLKKAAAIFDPQTSKPAVSMQFTKEGGEKFALITERNIGKQLAIFLDGYPISAPTVSSRIDGGDSIINGQFTLEEAKNLAVTLNAGALPVPIKIIKQSTVDPTLGKESVAASLKAGGVGLATVALFMIMNYGSLGVVSVIGLIIYGLLTLTLYKLIPITITSPGLAGFILSIGMAVDSNILIFERMKEELRKGRQWHEAMELGFGRAWDSIKDANIATLITTFILFNPLDWTFLNSSGMVRGFALTLFLGVVLSLFTGIFVTRNLLRVFTKDNKKSNNNI